MCNILHSAISPGSCICSVDLAEVEYGRYIEDDFHHSKTTSSIQESTSKGLNRERRNPGLSKIYRKLELCTNRKSESINVIVELWDIHQINIETISMKRFSFLCISLFPRLTFIDFT